MFKKNSSETLWEVGGQLELRFVEVYGLESRKLVSRLEGRVSVSLER